MSPPAAPPASASDALNPLDPVWVERFRRDVEALTGEAPTSARRLGLAVSGGPDSMAMLALAANAYPGAICAATVNHGLRVEAAAEAEMVARTCEGLRVPHAILQPNPRFSFAGNVQEQAREYRYHALYEWAGSFGQPRRAEWVAVAHHRDDVAESFLMRARRGSGVGGLAAMQRKRPITTLYSIVQPLIRPLLDWSRAELALVVKSAALECAFDPSNIDARYDRARMRQLLAEADELPPARLALSAQNLRHAEDALEWMFLREAQDRLELVDGEEVWLDTNNLPYELRRRLVVAAISETRMENRLFDEWDKRGVDRLIATLDSGGTATLAGIKVEVDGIRWHFTPAPPRRSL